VAFFIRKIVRASRIVILVVGTSMVGGLLIFADISDFMGAKNAGGSCCGFYFRLGGETGNIEKIIGRSGVELINITIFRVSEVEVLEFI
jgi:hypothetical protein